jgi:hypothetical protein
MVPNDVRLRTAALAWLILLAGAGCGRPGSSPARTSPSSSSHPYSQAALTEEKMTKFLESMKEEKNPLDFLFKSGGGIRSVAEMKGKEAGFTAFARKYGFADYNEYADTWGRIALGRLQIDSAPMFKSMAETTRQSIQEAEAQLRKPNLTAEQRQMYSEQLETGKRQLADLEKNDTNSLNAADLVLVEKFKPQIDAAEKLRNK